MDRSWMEIEDRRHPKYRDGVTQFLEFAYAHIEPSEEIRCPCIKCNNVYFHSREDVEADLYYHGMVKGYTTWIFHGEEFESSTDNDCSGESNGEDEDNDDHMQEMIHDFYSASTTNCWAGEQSSENRSAVPEGEADKFMRLLRDADQKLYPGCEKFSKLSFTVRLLHLKILSHWSCKSFTLLLELLKEAFSQAKTLPSSYNEAKKVIRDLGLDYERIHACKNDCVLFRKEYKDENACPRCNEPRYKVDTNNDRCEKSKKIPQKILRYFPLKPRLQRLFISKKTAFDMRWHKEKRVNEEGVLRHPADGEAWKSFDATHRSFAEDPRNVRLGLASDGFNPFSNMSTSHSTWPVVLVPYNLPPWKCMKIPFFILSMLIPGPKSPGNDIDVYLEPLIDELKELWEVGVETYDASVNTNFQLRAAVLWTINDFPAYGTLSGWSTKGFLACPVCNKETSHMWLKNGKKTCYMGHRRFLEANHKWRDDAKSFDGSKEHRRKPKLVSGDDVLEQLSHIDPVVFGKTQPKKRKREEELNWRKHSIFFQLPYWRTLKLRHNLDVMHIEKNICDSILGTLMDVSGKTKDNIKARLDLKAMGLRHQLHPKQEGNYYVMPPACYTMSTTEKKDLCEFLNSVKFPDGYASNISRRVNSKDCRISGMKSHDSHIFLQRLLPIAIRGSLENDVRDALIELSHFFRELCSRTLKVNVLKQLESQIITTLCKLERIFPMAFFDIMVHLPIHLAQEAILGGPEQYRWMYPFERHLYRLKCNVTNKAHPEGSIAEAYIAEECLTFCSMYLEGVETRFNRVERNYDGSNDQKKQGLSIFSHNFRPLGKGDYDFIDDVSWEQARMYVLKNCDEVLPFLTQHKEETLRESARNVEKRHEEKFPKWFENHVTGLYKQQNGGVNEQLMDLARGPDRRVTSYKACITNGLRFRTKDSEMHRRTQNSGIVVKGDDEVGSKDYYGVLTHIIQLDYSGDHRVFLFKCDWWDVGNEGRGIQTDKHKYTSVNVTKKWNTNEPFVLASQAEQVFYVNDYKLGNNWQVVVKAQARELYDVPDNEEEEIVEDEPYQQQEPFNVVGTSEVSNEFGLWSRDGIPLIGIDANLVSSEEAAVVNDETFINDESEDDDDTLIDYEDEEDEMSIDDDDDSDTDMAM